MHYRKARPLLKNYMNLLRKVIKNTQMVRKQSYWKINKGPPKMIHIPHYEINKVGEMHQ